MKGGRGPAPKFEGILGAGNRTFFWRARDPAIFFGGGDLNLEGNPLGPSKPRKKSGGKNFFP